jgi:hypothetical protein
MLSNQATQATKTSIPLRILFKYPTDKAPPSEGMNSFWKGGIQNLENEMEAYDILSTREEGVGGESESEDCGNDVEAPAMQVDFDGI